MLFLINTFATNLLACSNEAGYYLFGEKSVTKQKYTYFPNAIDYSTFFRTTEKDVKRFKREEGLGSCSIVVGHIGTFKESKNHKFLLEIMKRLIKKIRRESCRERM